MSGCNHKHSQKIYIFCKKKKVSVHVGDKSLNISSSFEGSRVSNMRVFESSAGKTLVLWNLWTLHESQKV